MRNILIVCVLMVGIFAGKTYAQPASNQHQVYCSRDNEKAFQTMKRLPEVQYLVNKVLQGGDFSITSSGRETSGFEGMWDSLQRRIVLNPYSNSSLGEKINTLMMELHNAAADGQLTQVFQAAQAGNLTKEQYVERVERIEHANAVNSSKLLAKGIRKGLYPKDAAWHIFENFDDHYMLQQILEHSTWIARNYDGLNPSGCRQLYRGTVPNLSRLSPQDRETLCRYLYLKNDMSHPQNEIRKRAQEHFARELSRVRSGGGGMWSRNQDAKHFDLVFGKNSRV